MIPGDNRRTFLSSLLLAGGSVAAFGASFRHDASNHTPQNDALFWHIQQQLTGAVRAAKGRGGVLTAEDAAAGAAYMRICAVHARGLDLDRVASDALSRQISSVGLDTLVNTALDVTRLRVALRRKGIALSDRIIRDLARTGNPARTAALESVQQGRTSRACDWLAEALEMAAPQLARERQSVRRAAMAGEGSCNYWEGQWSMCLLMAWYIASFQDPTLQAFLDALWAGLEFYDTLDGERC
jgi:hypothetical protein